MTTLDHGGFDAVLGLLALGRADWQHDLGSAQSQEALMTDPQGTAVWTCRVSGPVVHADIPPGGDFPMRQAVRAAYREVTGQDETRLSSGWEVDPLPEPTVTTDPQGTAALSERIWTHSDGSDDHPWVDATETERAEAIGFAAAILGTTHAFVPLAALEQADRFLTAGSSFNGHRGPDPIAAHLALVAILNGEWQPPVTRETPDPASPCTCGHRRDHHTNRDVDDVVGWPCLDCRSKRCRGFALRPEPAPEQEAEHVG